VAAKSSRPELKRSERRRSKANFLQELSQLQVIAKKHDNIPGYKAAACVQLGYPVFKMDTAVALAFKKRIPTVDEMMLRLIELGVDHSHPIADFLGIDHSMVEDHASRLAEMEQIRRASGDAKTGAKFDLMEAGKLLVKQLEFVQQQTETWTLFIDGNSRKICGHNKSGVALRTIVAKTCNERGIEVLDPDPREFPKAHEIDIADLEKRINSSGRTRRPGSGVAKTVQCITETSNYQMRYLPFHVVIYESEIIGEPIFKSVFSGPEIEEVEEFLNKDWWPSYKRAFLPSDEIGIPPVEAVKMLAISATEKSSVVQEAETKIRDIEVQIIRKETEPRSSDNTKSEAEIADLKRQLEAAKTQAQNAVLAQKKAEADAESKASKTSHKVVEWNEHVQYLADAVENSKRRLLIVSPWIKKRIVDNTFYYRLKSLLGNGVSIRILFGMPFDGRHEGQSTDPAVIDDFRSLAKEGDFKSADLSFVNGTHEKVLIKDDEFIIVSSHNWLSYDGKRSQRGELGALISDKNTIDAQWAKFERILQEALAKPQPVIPPSIYPPRGRSPGGQRPIKHGKFPKMHRE